MESPKKFRRRNGEMIKQADVEFRLTPYMWQIKTNWKDLDYYSAQIDPKE
jgi:hypothetical protein